MTRKSTHACRACGRRLKTHRLAKVVACSYYCRQDLKASNKSRARERESIDSPTRWRSPGAFSQGRATHLQTQ